MRQGTAKITVDQGMYWFNDIPEKTKTEIFRRASGQGYSHIEISGQKIKIPEKYLTVGFFTVDRKIC